MMNCLLVIGKSRDLDVKEWLSYALTLVLLSLGTGDGPVCKTNTSKSMHELEKGTECVSVVPLRSAFIMDGMAFIQEVQISPCTFGELTDKLLNDLVNMVKCYACVRVNCVCD